MNIKELKQALELALQEQNYIQLEELAKQAVREHPNEAFGYDYLAEAFRAEEPIPFAQVEICLAKAAELDPSNPDYLAKFALVKTMQGEENAAQLMWGKVLALDPDYLEALTAKGAYQLIENKDYGKALPFLNKAIEQSDQTAMPFLYRAQVHNATGNPELALKDIQRATTLEPDFDRDVAYLKIEVYTSLKQFDQVLSIYEQLLLHYSEEAYIHYEYALLLQQLGQLDKAVDHFLKTAELSDRQDASYEYQLGEAALQNTQYEIAKTAFKNAMELDPEQTEAAFQLIALLLLEEDYTEALAVTEQIKEHVKDDNTQSNRLVIAQATALIGLKKEKKAENILVPIAKLPGLFQADAYFQLGRLYYQQNDLVKAYRFVKAASVQDHAPAQEFLKTHLQDVLTKLRTAAITSNKAAFSKNERSKFLNQLFGKLWVFDDLKSERADGFSGEHLANLKASLSSSSLVIAEKGILMLSEQREQLATYKIQKKRPQEPY